MNFSESTGAQRRVANLRHIGGPFIALALICGAAHAGTAPQYSLTDLGVLPGDLTSVAVGLNDQGQVVGNSTGSSGGHAFIYADGSMAALAPASPFATSSGGINSAGEVVGSISFSNSTGRAVRYSGGGVVDLGTTAGSVSEATAVNLSGQVVGNERIAGNSHAFLYSVGATNDLGTFGGINSFATAINSSGQLVGYYLPGGSTHHAYEYQNGMFKDLGSLGGASSETYAFAINDAGDIVGQSEVASGFGHAFLVHDGNMIDLDPLDPQGSIAEGINVSGEVVGAFEGLSARAFLYTNGALYDLNGLVNAPGYKIEDARAIDAAGEIAATATLSTGVTHAVLLTPTAVPLPAAAWPALTMCPLILAGRWVRRSRRCMMHTV